MLRLTGIAIASLILLGAWAPPAGALTPHLAEKAEVVFSNGGRILSMKADGSERTVLFGKSRDPKNDELGAVEPDVSPDGKTVVFGYRRETAGDQFTDIWRVRTDGTDSRRLLASKPGFRYGDPVFGPDGQVVVAYFRTGRGSFNAGLISIDPAGESRQVLLDVRQKRRPYTSPSSIMEPAVSPDGKKVLYLVNSGYSGSIFDEGFENPMMIVNLATGKSRKVADDAYGGAWSPDGQRIVYSVQTDDDDLEICWWESGCNFKSTLAVINADGTGGRKFLTGRRLDERSPDWSADGRIIFQSARNMPAAGEAYEIYSIRPNGKCLTMLTNGSPASVTPAWSDGKEASSAPSQCGAMPPDSGAEIGLPSRIPESVFWLGERFGSRLFSGVATDRTGAFFLYLDCDRQSRGDCDRPLGMVSADICTYTGGIAEAFSEGSVIRRQRGLPIYLSLGAEIGPVVYLFTDRTVTYFFGGSGKGSARGNKEVAGLRNLSQESATTEELPRPMLPAFDIRLMKKVKRIFAATGSIAAAARRLDRPVGLVKRNLRLDRRLKAIGEYGTVNCPRPERVSDSGSIG